MTITNIDVKLIGEDGNAFSIIGCVQKEMKRNNIEKTIIDQYVKEATSGDYDQLLQITYKYVNVI